MKYTLLLLILVLFTACNGNPQKGTEKKPESIYVEPDNSEQTSEKPAFTGKKDICWEGKLDGKTPVFVHYQLNDQVVIGEITYLNTKGKKPIKLAGTVETDQSFRFLEFDKTGNITGVMYGQLEDETLIGSWYSPKSGKELKMNCSLSDSIIKSVDIEANSKKISGEYYYQYGAEGYLGSFDCSKLKGDHFSFSVESVTGEPARNMAIVDTDTISLKGTSFIYAVPESDDCEFKVRFFKDFVFIDYTKGTCMGDFGHNATVEGIYLKVK